MKVHSKQITAYIDFLKQAGFTVTLHGSLINNSLFLAYNYHQNPYCHYVKTVYGKWEECICRQKKVYARCKEGSFFGCCYAGVGEFVYPVLHNGEVACFVSVSGFFTEQTPQKAAHFAQKNELSAEELSELSRRHLDPKLPQKQAVDAVIEPLVFLLEAYFEQKRESGTKELALYHKVLRYVTENCHRRLTMQELSREFHYSVSTLSHLFLKNSGKSLPAYIEDLRLNEAKWYLRNSKTGITEIAIFLGYNSSNYFSAVFKKKFGITPRAYRKSG